MYLYWGEILIIASSAAVALLFTETTAGREKEQSGDKPGLIACLKKQYVDSFKIIKGNNRLIYMITFLNILGVFTTTAFFYMQIYCKGNGMKENAIGIVFAVSCVLGAAGGLLAHRVEAFVKERKLLFSLPIIFMILLWGMVWFRTALITFTVIAMFDSLMYVVYFDYVNRLIPSAERATLLSFSSMVFSFFMVLIFPVFGKIGDIFGLNYSFGFMACVATALVVVNLAILAPKKIKD